jgi:hypothetical protein
MDKRRALSVFRSFEIVWERMEESLRACKDKDKHTGKISCIKVFPKARKEKIKLTRFS